MFILIPGILNDNSPRSDYAPLIAPFTDYLLSTFINVDNKEMLAKNTHLIG